LLHHQSESTLSDYRATLFMLLSQSIKNRALFNRDGYVNTLMIKYILFEQCPYLVDDELLQTILQDHPELYFLDEFTIGIKPNKEMASWDELLPEKSDKNPWSDGEDNSGWDNISCRATTSSIRIDSDTSSDLEISDYQSSSEEGEVPTDEYFDQIPGKFDDLSLGKK